MRLPTMEEVDHIINIIHDRTVIYENGKQRPKGDGLSLGFGKGGHYMTVARIIEWFQEFYDE